MLTLHKLHEDADIVGLDDNAYKLALAPNLPNVEYIHANAQSMPLGDATFDRIVAAYQLSRYSLQDIMSVVLECARVLKHGGVLSVYDRIPYTEHAHEHYAFTVTQLQSILTHAGFAACVVEYNDLQGHMSVSAWRSITEPVKQPVPELLQDAFNEFCIAHARHAKTDHRNSAIIVLSELVSSQCSQCSACRMPDASYGSM
ncbi:S-adenosyl-L-methionine-dependent methyltransferase [Tribonema minus]|uniref:S-adenosyl-L-methionine-dependent methyltransferase n=1 Tax=Tribonema minus TaxID=303371 RepID=A0A835Z4D1_9STRA|nr:S-adenosyl-L-methionine-dependent methyltransferase [Tribonema minus]